MEVVKSFNTLIEDIAGVAFVGPSALANCFHGDVLQNQHTGYLNYENDRRTGEPANRIAWKTKSEIFLPAAGLRYTRQNSASSITGELGWTCRKYWRMNSSRMASSGILRQPLAARKVRSSRSSVVRPRSSRK